MTKQLHYFTIKAEGANQKPFRLGVKVRDAKRPVTLTRTLSDLLKGTEGLAITCANVQCALRENEAALGHRAFLAEFTDKRAFIVDKLDRHGVPVSSVRYAHNQGSFQQAYDKKGKNYFRKLSKDQFEGEFTLYPPPKAVAKGKGTNRKYSKTSGTSGSERERKRSKRSRGAMARFARMIGSKVA